MRIRHVHRLGAVLILTIVLVSACGPVEATTPAPSATYTVRPPQVTAEQVQASSATPLPEIEPGLREITNQDDLRAQFNLDLGTQRLILLLSNGCPSCVAGAEWVQERILATHPDLDLRVYAIWFPTVDASQLSSEANPYWDPEAIHDPRALNFWDAAGAVSAFMAANVELEGLDRFTVPRTFGGLQWGTAVWDTYYLYAQDSEWGDVPSNLLQSGYPILDQRASLAEALSTLPIVDTDSSTTSGTFEIDPRSSVATYRVQETLLGREINIAVGFTHEIGGRVEVDLGNLRELELSPVVVDISSLKSDNFLRDERLQQEFLESATYPLATFTPQSFSGLPESAREGESIGFEIEGTLEVREQAVPTTFQVTARLEAGRLVGLAVGQILMTDFGFQSPAIGDLIAAENEVQLELEFVAVLTAP